MTDDPRKRLDISLDGVAGRAFGDPDVVEQVLGREVPAALKDLWSRFGEGALSDAVFIYDAELVVDLLEQYEDAGLAGLLPLASDGGSRDFAVDLVGRSGLPSGTILLLDRGTMTEGSLQPVAADVVEFRSRHVNAFVASCSAAESRGRFACRSPTERRATEQG